MSDFRFPISDFFACYMTSIDVCGYQICKALVAVLHHVSAAHLACCPCSSAESCASALPLAVHSYRHRQHNIICIMLDCVYVCSYNADNPRSQICSVKLHSLMDLQDEHILARKYADKWMAKALGVGLFKRRLYRKEVEDTRQVLYSTINPLAKVSC